MATDNDNNNEEAGEDLEVVALDNDEKEAIEPEAIARSSRPRPDNAETRKFFGVRLETRDATRGPGTLVGYAAVFSSESHDLGGFRETIAPGAFARSLREGADVRALRDHDPSKVLGRSASGTLRVHEDANGLRSEIDLPDTELGRETAELVRRGDLDGMSFGFTTEEERWEERQDGPLRELVDVEVFDVSVVSFPAYPEAAIEGVRSFRAWKQSSDVSPDEEADGGDPQDLRRAIALRLASP